MLDFLPRLAEATIRTIPWRKLRRRLADTLVSVRPFVDTPFARHVIVLGLWQCDNLQQLDPENHTAEQSARLEQLREYDEKHRATVREARAKKVTEEGIESVHTKERKTHQAFREKEVFAADGLQEAAVRNERSRKSCRRKEIYGNAGYIGGGSIPVESVGGIPNT